jgi:hypothetical protein
MKAGRATLYVNRIIMKKASHNNAKVAANPVFSKGQYPTSIMYRDCAIAITSFTGSTGARFG